MKHPLREAEKVSRFWTHLINPYRGLTSHGKEDKPAMTAA